MTTPTLTTDRLTLRAPRLVDFPVYAAFLASERSKGVGGPLDTRQAWDYFCHDTALWSLAGHGALMMDLSATGETIGSISVNSGPLFPETELGWMVYDGFTGRGYATEAARAVRDWVFASLGLTTLVSYIDPANAASIRVAQRLGGVIDPDAPTPFDEPDLVYRYHPGGRA
jgi:RimJ/RimL family protein N-acetyltransferase